MKRYYVLLEEDQHAVLVKETPGSTGIRDLRDWAFRSADEAGGDRDLVQYVFKTRSTGNVLVLGEFRYGEETTSWLLVESSSEESIRRAWPPRE